jgi:hypothetical protein
VIEQEIRNLLLQGYSPKFIISKGFKKSTVYSIYNELSTITNTINKPSWEIINLNTDRGFFTTNTPRYLPGERLIIIYDFINTSNKDLYLIKLGIQPEWLINENKWFCKEFKEILHPGEIQHVSLKIHIPENIRLGEYEFIFGMEGQYLPAIDPTPLFTQLNYAIVLHIKHLIRLKLFLSHSIIDIKLVKEIESQLDNYGIECIIGEDIQKPGKLLREKFEELIKSSDIFIALLTESATTSEWVLHETNYALKIGKPTILLKEESVQIKSDIEWISFSKNMDSSIIFNTLISAMRKIEIKNTNTESLISILFFALMGFFIGYFFGSKK